MRKLAFLALFLPELAFSGLWQNGEKDLVKEVYDGDSFVLQSGLSVKLAQIDAPRIQIGDDEGVKSRDFLEKLIKGKMVKLKYGGLRRDRMGRALAQVFVGTGQNEIWVQMEMLKAGRARIHTFEDNRASISEFWQAERQARHEGIGLWANPAFMVREGTKEALKGTEYTFQLVEGNAKKVWQEGKMIHILFGENEAEDFGALIPETAFHLWQNGKDDILALQGHDIRIRGQVSPAVSTHESKTGKKFRAHGPQIWLNHPEQIEFIIKAP